MAGRCSQASHVRRLAAVAAALACSVFTACAGDSRPSRVDPVVRLQTQLTRPARLVGSYVFEGRRRRVDAEIAFDNLRDPYRSSIAVPDRGARRVAVEVRVLNRGPEPFPFEWARFKGYDSSGHALPAGTESTPLRKTVADRPVRGQVLASLTAFQIPRGRRLASIRMSSIVELWPFRARWTVKP